MARLNKWFAKALSVTAIGAALDASLGNMILSVSGTSGSRTITSITGGGAAQWIIFVFTDSNVSITSAAVTLAGGAASFAGTAGDILSIATYDGTTWHETGRKLASANSAITGTLTVTGAAALNGGITVDSTAFVVADTTGNVSTTGTLTVTGATALNGGLTMDSTAFTVADTSGNTAIAGTLTVTGASAFNGGITCDSTAFTVADTSGNVATAGTLNVTGLSTLQGGIAAAGGFSFTPRLIHTGGIPAQVNTDGTDATPVNTEVYIAEIFVPATITATGVSVFNGSAVAGNLKVGLADSTGAVVATSASTAQSGTDAYQRVPFTGTYAMRGPATYYVLAMFDTNTTPRFNAHTFGDFGAAKQTGQVFATGFTTITPPTTFTTALAPIASLY